MKTVLRLLIGLLVLATAGIDLRAAESPAKAAPIVGGPAVESRIRFEIAIYYPVHPTIQPQEVLRAQVAADAGMPRPVQALPDAHADSVVAGRWVGHALEDYTPPSAALLSYFSHGLTPAQAAALPRADEAFVMDFAHAATDRMRALRNAQVLVERIARDTHGLIWDDETREAFTPEAWHERRMLGWEGDVPDVARQTIIHMYPTDPLYRCITLGMGKFGLPDIVVEHVVASDGRPVGNLINALAQALVEGGSADAQGGFELRLQQSAHPAVNRRQGEGLKPNAEHMARLLLVKGHRDDGDPRNRLVQIAFDRHDGPDEHARRSALLTALYGGEDSITRVRHDARLLAARDAARARLPGLREAFVRGLPPGEFIQVKAPFDTDGGGREWMWVEVVAWNGDRIEGTLQNTPSDAKRLRMGQQVVVSQSDLFDYIFHHADGRDEGNTTGAVIEEEERAARQR